MVVLTEVLQYVNLGIVPVLIWIIKVEKQLVRIETILEIKRQKGGPQNVPEITTKNVTDDNIGGNA